MHKYYTLLSPALCGDWGDVILVDSRVAELIKKATGYYDNTEEVVSLFKNEDWQFLKEELKGQKLEDKEFIEFLECNWNSSMAENYYDLADLNSTIKFGGISGVVKYAIAHNIEIVGELY